MKIFIDTSALISYYNVDDEHHAEAFKAMEKIKKGEIPLTRFYITDYIFDETITFIECVLNRHELALNIGEALQTSPFTIMIRTNEDLFKEAWSFFREDYGDEPFVRLVRARRGIHRYPEPKILTASNHCDIGFEVDQGNKRLVVIAAIDNLMKGAAGSAVQALNLMYGWPETLGLEFPGLHPI